MKKGEIEKEIKVLNINPSILEERIIVLGGQEIQNGLTHMWWYDIGHLPEKLPPCAINNPKDCGRVLSVATTLGMDTKESFRDRKIYFRVRQEDVGCDLTLKYKIGVERNVISNSEISYELKEGELQNIKSCLLQSGFECIAIHEKRRQSFLLVLSGQEIRIDIDEWPGIPPYVEIEAHDVNLITKAVHELGLSEREVSTAIGQEFFLSHGIDFFSNRTFESA